MRTVVSFIIGLLAIPGCAQTHVKALSVLSPPAFVETPLGPSQGPYTLGEIDEDSVKATTKFLSDAKASGARFVTLRINSPGGSVDEGFELAQFMEHLGIPIRCEVDGLAASMAAFVLMSCNTRVMTARSTVMIHEPSVGGLIRGNETSFRNIADRLRTITAMLIKHTAKRMHLTEAELHERIDGGREFWLTSDDALKFGAVDAVI